ncbi:MAG: hypothetical protein WBA39_06135, partial [Rivularia sp. (in: cyanobacteria)]
LIEKLIQLHQEKGKINFQEFELNLILEKDKTPLITPLAFPGKVLASDSKLFIADSGHHRIVISNLEGNVLHLIGSDTGLKDGSFEEAKFFAPQGMAFDEVDNILYVADTENHAIRKVDFKSQKVETIAGINENLNSPWDLVKLGNKLFIAMAGCHQIWELDLDTNFVKVFAGRGAESCFDASLLESAFAQPSGIATNGSELYIADSEVSSIRSIDLEKQLVKTICGSGDLNAFGDVDGQGFDVRLQHCLGIEYFDGFLYVADTYNHKIKLVNPATGDCKGFLEDGFSEPSGLSIFDNYLYVADTNNHAIRKVNLDTLVVERMEFFGLCAADVCILLTPE